jgi:hypothetical protein
MYTITWLLYSYVHTAYMCSEVQLSQVHVSTVALLYTHNSNSSYRNTLQQYCIQRSLKQLLQYEQLVQRIRYCRQKCFCRIHAERYADLLSYTVTTALACVLLYVTSYSFTHAGFRSGAARGATASCCALHVSQQPLGE